MLSLLIASIGTAGQNSVVIFEGPTEVSATSLIAMSVVDDSHVHLEAIVR